jgi:uncharacterized membrane protein YqhA
MSEETARPATRRHTTAGMIGRVASGTRYLMIVAVLGCFLGSATLLVYGAISAVQTIVAAIIAHAGVDKTMKELMLSFVEMIDLFLLGAVLYIVALGLYQLFIDDALELPRWLEVHDLDDLKAKVIGVIIVLLGVIFLGNVINWDGQRDILALGIAISLVMAALTFMYFLGHRQRHSHAAPHARHDHDHSPRP